MSGAAVAMSPVHPEILIGLGLAAIPVVLHFLMRSKPRPLLFPALRLIQNRKRTNTRRLRLRHIWLLLLRVAFLALLVTAIARLRLPPANYGLSGREAAMLAAIGVAAVAAYQVVTGRWRRRRVPTHVYTYRRTLLRGGLGAAAAALALLLVAWPYWQRVRAELTEPRPEIFQNVPVAAVFVFDTSPSMEYTQEGRTRLEAAQEVATKFLADLPAQSRVAVTDSSSHGPILFQTDLPAARSRIEAFQSRPVSVPLDERLRAALLVQEKDAEQTLSSQADVPEDQRSDRYLREIYVFTDMAASDWRKSAASMLRRELERQPRVRVYLIDVGVENRTNASVAPIRLPEESVSAGGELVVRSGIASVGMDGGERTAELSVVGPKGEIVKQGTRTVTLSAGAAQDVEFVLSGFTGPVVQGEIRLTSGDPLAADDVRYFTAAVRQPPKILIVADRRDDQLDVHDALAPPGLVALGKAPYEVEYVPTARFEGDALKDLSRFEVVCLINASAPSEAAWTALESYVRGGGGLFVAMGDMHGEEVPVQVAYHSEAARTVLPLSDEPEGMPVPRRWEEPVFLDLPDLTHPVFAVFESFQGAGLLTSQPVRGAWVFASGDGGEVVARFTDGTPALVERSHESGRILVLTTALDLRGWSDLPRADWQFVVFLDQVMRHLGQPSRGGYNFDAGEAALVPLDRDRPLGEYLLLKPQLEQTAGEAADGADSLAIRETEQPGNYQIRQRQDGGRVYTGFTVNLAAGESDFTRITKGQLDELLGEERYRIGKGSDDLEKIVGEDRIPIEVFPHVLALVLAAFCAEHFVANRFYEADQTPPRT